MTPAESINPDFDALLLSRIEDAGLNASAPPQQVWLDGWLVRFSAGKAKRARCINAVATGRGTLSDRLAASGRIFDRARLPLIVRITPFTLPTDLDALLQAHGLARFDDTRVMVLADLREPALRSTPPGTGALALSIRSVGLDAFTQRVGGFRASPLAHRQAHAERLLNSPVPFSAFELCIDGQPVACGQIAVENDIAGLYDVFTAPQARGQGYARQLCLHLLAEAAARGAKHAYLQVEGDNAAARAVYHRIGFVDGYRYHYRTTDPSAA